MSFAILKDSLGLDVAAAIADRVLAAGADFDPDAFLEFVRFGPADDPSAANYADLELLDRASRIAVALGAFLPADRGEAIEILQRSLPSEDESGRWHGMQGFMLSPHSAFVALYGLDNFETSMQFQYQLTKRFTAEFSIRAFIDAHYEPTMAMLREWVSDDNEHVRRLVSEGTRPRLPWASRLRRFQDDPAPVLELLEQLRDDPSEYVRRSVANNLNDIAKDHPDVVLDLAARWWTPDSSPQRRKLIRHALRTQIKAGDARALAVLGYAADDAIGIEQASVEPSDPRIGDSVRICLTITYSPDGGSDSTAGVLVDIAVDFVKKNGSTGRKVFKGAMLELAPGATGTVRKTIALRQLSTRTVYPGVHKVTAIINGHPHPLPAFTLVP